MSAVVADVLMPIVGAILDFLILAAFVFIIAKYLLREPAVGKK